MDKYIENTIIFKALSDVSRLKILDILSCGEMCGSDLLKYFDFTQPTLSHHMKILSECNLINICKKGTSNHYSLNTIVANRSVLFLLETVTNTDNCICKKS